MAFLGLMCALIAGSALVRVLVKTAGVSAERHTGSDGCGCLVAVLVLAAIALLVAMF